MTTTCPNCSGEDLFVSKEVSSGGGHSPNFLPGVGGFFSTGKFRLITCTDCGLTRFFAAPQHLSKIAQSKDWQKL